jgi:uncharacterized membrane protein
MLIWIKTHSEYVVGVLSGLGASSPITFSLLDPVLAITTSVISAVLSAIAVHFVKKYFLNRKNNG